MSRIAFDTETYLIASGNLAPRLVCGSFYAPSVSDEARLADREETLDSIEEVLKRAALPATMTVGIPHIVVQNAAFDMGVIVAERPHLLPLVFAAYDAGRIRCTRIREKLIAIARGELKDEDHPGKKISFALDALVLKRFNVDISADKKDPTAWRLRYHELDGVPLDQWPAEAVRYAKDDAVWHMKVFEDQARECGLAEDLEGYFPNEREQTRRAFALHLMGMWGIRTDPAAVQALSDRIAASVDIARGVLTHPAHEANAILRGVLAGTFTLGLGDPDAVAKTAHFKKHLETIFDGVEVDWSVPEGEAANPIIRLTQVRDRETKQIRVDESMSLAVLRALVDHAYKGAAPRTEKGNIQYSDEVLEATRDPRLLLKASIGTDDGIKSKWLDHLWNGTGKPITADWNNPLATGRTSCAKPPLQQPPRKGGVRECFVPRPGFWFLATDYTHIELNAWGQVCLRLFGYSDMADNIRAGKDPHCVMAVEIIRAENKDVFSYESPPGVSVFATPASSMTLDFFMRAKKAGAPWTKEYRQLAKAANFGYPGGLVAKTFVAYAWGNYGVRLDVETALLVRQAWLNTYREAQAYLDHFKAKAPAWGDTFSIVQHGSDRVRGGCTYTSGANSMFQGLATDGSEEAEWRITKECYLGPESGLPPVDTATDFYADIPISEFDELIDLGFDPHYPLHGCRRVLFLHDENVVEVPAHPWWAHFANKRLTQHMVEGMQVFVPDIPVKAEETLMDRWRKEAGPVYDEKGRLTLWHPKEVA